MGDAIGIRRRVVSIMTDGSDRSDSEASRERRAAAAQPRRDGTHPFPDEVEVAHVLFKPWSHEHRDQPHIATRCDTTNDALASGMVMPCTQPTPVCLFSAQSIFDQYVYQRTH